MHNAVIAGYSRSPFTISYKGELKSLRPEDILAQVINKLISPSNLNKDDIEDVIVGSIAGTLISFLVYSIQNECFFDIYDFLVEGIIVFFIWDD